MNLWEIFRKTNISYPLKRTSTCAYQGVRNVSFSENFPLTYIPSEIIKKRGSSDDFRGSRIL